MNLLDSIKQFFTFGGEGQPVVDVNKRFELLGRTGQGSMSKVWRARDRRSARTVCLKILDKEKTEKFEARFVGLKKPSEGEICMLLKHENIVQTFSTEIGTTSRASLTPRSTTTLLSSWRQTPPAGILAAHSMKLAFGTARCRPTKSLKSSPTKAARR